MKIGQRVVFKDGNTYTIEKINDMANDLFQIEEEKCKFRKSKTWFGEDGIDYKKTILKHLSNLNCGKCPIVDGCRGMCCIDKIVDYLNELYN
ncbi:hypothetical protein [Peptostreptococcus porci]|uniref:hypothetical protein n=1 Tax=Peptostreptococcus porci TaxID=2652282 RepID=UPI002A81277C|nr:hypothetical protein [Peptostreptococcus porci]MDY4127765.1 hypothetical protein [Peptostreptococcus porci]